MKIIFNLLIITVFCACTNDNNHTEDEILSNMTWVCKISNVIPPDTNTRCICAYIDDYTEWFPTFKKPQITYSSKDSTISKLLSDEEYNILNFYSDNCNYIIQECQTLEKYNIRLKYTTSTHQPQICIGHFWKGIDTLIVTNNGIYMHFDSQYPSCHQMECLPLNNYRFTALTEEDTLAIKTDTVFKNNPKELFSFKRNEDEIILHNKNRKIVGNLDRKMWTLKLTQIHPEIKELNTLKPQ